ncbi:MAG: GTPase domain-containing protein [Candidatus Electryonea clarkiae]|nr:GTPase domain-containing protein [Candidatus Electryonea clarkiae]MDP8287270.1 GTPase domain-containing protein [Candidatus Electryonea clarkiae]
MATVNFGRREILSKIVYYGPGMCGKTTNLQTIHGKVPEKLRGNLTSVATQQDRTLFFDLLPIEIGKIQGFSIRMQLYTVPGQVYYNASRKIVLRGVDGIVFVADSQAQKMRENIESLQNLSENLKELGIDPANVPLVMQYNKRDLSPLSTVEELNKELNSKEYAYFESIAVTGHGVFDTLKAITSMVVKEIREKLAKQDTSKITAAPQPVQPPASTAQPAAASPQPAQAAAKPVVEQSSVPASGQGGGVATPKPAVQPQPVVPTTPPDVSADQPSKQDSGESEIEESQSGKKKMWKKLPFRFRK